MKKILLSIAVLLLAFNAANAQKFEELAKTPPMGWNSWNHFKADINEQNIKEMADAMVTSGLRDAGYVYLNLDDIWHGERDANGFITCDAKNSQAE
jgi:alpha-galactosidase